MMNHHAPAGRSRKLARWKELLADPVGQAVIVAGKPGSGKTFLLDRMVAEGLKQESLCCAAVRYVVPPTDSPGMVMRNIMEDVFFAARAKVGLLETRTSRFYQWNTVIDRLGLAASAGGTGSGGVSRTTSGNDACALLNKLRYDPSKNVFDQFRERLELISRWMPRNGRLIIVLDPEREMHAFRHERWRSLVATLPSKLKLLFAQRPEDPLVVGHEVLSCPDIPYMPGTPDGLAPLEDADIDFLLAGGKRLRTSFRTGELKAKLDFYRGNPYSVGAAIAMLEFAEGTLDDLPTDEVPERMAEAQWNRLATLFPGDPEVVSLFRAYAVLETVVPDAIVCAVAGVEAESLERYLKRPYVRSLIRDEPGGRCIYHAYLADTIRSTMRLPDGSWNEEAKRFHQIAAYVYQSRLHSGLYPDALATLRLPEHTLHAEGPNAFVKALCFCEEAFRTLGLWVAYGNLLEKSLGMIPAGSPAEIDIRYRLGRLRMRQENHDAAQREFEIASERIRSYDDPKRAALLTMEIGRLFFLQKRWSKSERAFRRGIEAYRKIGDTAGVIEGLRALAEVQIRLGHTEEAETTLDESHRLCETITLPRLRQRTAAGVLCAIGMLDESRGCYDKAAERFHEALDLTKELYDREIEAEIHLYLRDIEQQIGDLPGAEKNLAKAIRIFEELHMIENAAEGYYHLAILEQGQEKDMVAGEHFHKAQTLFRQLGNRRRTDAIEQILEERRRCTVNGYAP